MNQSIIYDYETLGKHPQSNAVVALAICAFSLDECRKGTYTFDGLYEETNLLLFDIEEQIVKYGRTIDIDTLNWWETDVSEAVRKKCFAKNGRVSIEQVPKTFKQYTQSNPDFIFSRGNTFDPPFTGGIMDTLGLPPAYPFWKDRDTRSFLDAYLWDTDIGNSFIPEGLGDKDLHDPETDIIIDILRIQTVLSNVS